MIIAFPGRREHHQKPQPERPAEIIVLPVHRSFNAPAPQEVEMPCDCGEVPFS